MEEAQDSSVGAGRINKAARRPLISDTSIPLFEAQVILFVSGRDGYIRGEERREASSSLLSFRSMAARH